MLIQFNRIPRTHILQKHRIVFHQEQRGLALCNEGFHLLAAVYVDVVQRLVPHIKVGGDAQAPGQQELLFLPLAHGVDGLVEQLPAKVHVPQDGLEQGLVHAALLDEAAHIAPEEVRLLGHVGDDQVAGDAYLAIKRAALAAQRLEDAALARAVAPGERHPVSLPQLEADALRHGALAIAGW